MKIIIAIVFGVFYGMGVASLSENYDFPRPLVYFLGWVGGVISMVILCVI